MTKTEPSENTVHQGEIVQSKSLLEMMGIRNTFFDSAIAACAVALVAFLRRGQTEHEKQAIENSPFALKDRSTEGFVGEMTAGEQALHYGETVDVRVDDDVVPSGIPMQGPKFNQEEEEVPVNADNLRSLGL